MTGIRKAFFRFRAALLITGLFLALFFPGVFESGIAQEIPSPADLKSSYQKARLDTSIPFGEELKKLIASYQSALERRQTALQEAGQLEALLEIRKEIETLGSTGEPGTDDTTDTELQKLRGIFQKSKQDIVNRQGEAVAKVTSTYKTALDALVPELTRAGKVEEAIQARTMAEAIAENQPKVSSSSKLSSRPDGENNPPGAGEIPVDVTSRAERRLTEVPEIEAPPFGPDIFNLAEWPLLATLAPDNYTISGQQKYEGKKGMKLAISENSTFRGDGDKPYWNVANAVTVGKALRFEGFRFHGNLGSRLYFEQSSFDNMLIGKGGGWFGGAFMSRWQFRSCAIRGSFIEKWITRQTGVQMLGCRIEDVTFPPLEYHDDDDPSAIAKNDQMMILDSCFFRCTIPVSVLSLTEDCGFIECRFVDDLQPLQFAGKVKRTLKVENCQVEYKALPVNLELDLRELDRR